MHTNPSSTIQKTLRSILLTRCLPYNDPHLTHLNWYQNNQSRSHTSALNMQITITSLPPFKSNDLNLRYFIKHYTPLPKITLKRTTLPHCQAQFIIAFPSKAPGLYVVTATPILNPRISNSSDNFSQSDSSGETEVGWQERLWRVCNPLENAKRSNVMCF